MHETKAGTHVTEVVDLEADASADGETSVTSDFRFVLVFTVVIALSILVSFIALNRSGPALRVG